MGVLVMALTGNGHIDDEAVERYSLGNISEEESARVEEHLFTCAACRRRLEQTEAYTRAMQSAAARARGKQQERPVWWMPPRWLGGVAAAALAVVIALAGLRLWNTRPAAPPFAVHLSTVRGANAAAAPAGRRLVLEPDLSALPPLPSYRLELVDRMGKRIWQGSAGAAVPSMPEGIYFVRLYSPEGKLLREYGLEVKK